MTVDELGAALQTENVDRILEAMNIVKRMRDQQDILPFIKDLWEERQDKYPHLPWHVIKFDIVRLEVSNILLQAASNRSVEVDKHRHRQLALPLADSTDIQVAERAIKNLGIISDERDVSTILAIAKRENRLTFRTSVLALATMCGELPERALDELADQVAKAGHKAFIAETRQDPVLYKIRQHRCAGQR